MSLNLTETTITAAVHQAFATAPNERFRQLLGSVVQHLHDFARETRLTNEEWSTALDFLERVGKISSPTRQEFTLLSDILGVSMLLDTINQPGGSCATHSALLGPFYIPDLPEIANGADISHGVPGTPLFVTGRVITEHGDPLAGVSVDTWHNDSAGLYDVQQAEKLHNELAMRARLATDAHGRFWYRSITPRSYPVPTDGPCGEILRAANRSAMRPQHVHFRLRAAGYQPLTTQLFLREDPYIDQDAVFAAQDGLLAEFVRHEPGVAPDDTTVDQPFVTLDWTFTLAAAQSRPENT